ncbi:undecaprenyl-diphosphate phosphatase [Prolixibacteraceae bacterium JC049]|nr:undecaprenyl-diphosphate phosphatase [Prolixibacteraceae bacterium JC049]
MSILESIILGIIQGLTEFLPVSSSGHLELGHAVLGMDNKENLLFATVVHGATVLSTLVVFRKDIIQLITGIFAGNKESIRYALLIMLSCVPVFVVGIFFKDKVESLYAGNIAMVGFMLLITALLLSLTHFSKSGKKSIGGWNAVIIGIAQTLAVVPGISRSGATIATSLLMGNDKKEATRFSFLMVLIPIIGANFLQLLSGEVTQADQIGTLPLVAGFISAFVFGLLACSWMLRIVQRGKLIYFALYCFIIGAFAIFAG